jgi:cytochrome c oxidase subunit 2
MFARLRRSAPRLLPALLLLGIFALLLSGCDTDTPQNTFDAKGDVAEKQRDIFYLAMWPAIAVMIGVFGAIIVMCLRFRERDPAALPPKQVHGNTRLEIAWTIAPAVLLLILGVPMVDVLFDIGRDPSDDAYYIDVQAQRYSFFFTYPEILDENGEPLSFIAGTDAHIPAGREVAFRLHSDDVVHSFWIPKLGGKLDIVPGNNNVLWLQVEEPGTYHGQCVEYCGLDHANMQLLVHADSPEDFARWAAEQTGGGEPADEETGG